jgi:hypothetical protein
LGAHLLQGLARFGEIDRAEGPGRAAGASRKADRKPRTEPDDRQAAERHDGARR